MANSSELATLFFLSKKDMLLYLFAMKPKDLKPFFTFAERRPFLQDHVFSVPIYYFDHEPSVFPKLRDHFGNENPVCLEYCSGNGDWIFEKAKENPEKNWIAVEKRFDRVRKIWSKVKNHQLANLLIIHADAYTFTHHYLQEDQIDAIYINFPDPWPKGKHAKHRLIGHAFLDEMARVLKTGKSIMFVTDDVPYLNQAITHFLSHPYFSPSFSDPFFTMDFPGYGNSWFENLWRGKGKQIYYTQFIHAPDSIHRL